MADLEVSDSMVEDLEDFRNFIFLVHKFLGLDSPTELQFSIANDLQTGGSREAIQAFRGCGKSHLSALYAIWTLYHHPNAKFLVVSAAKKRASEFVKFCKEVIDTCPFLVHMKPKEGQRNLSYCFDVSYSNPSQTPSLEAKGIEGMITGCRADVIICDDLEVSINSMSVEAREKLQGLATEFEPILLPDGAVPSRIVYLGTPHSSSSIYNALPAQGYKVRRYPAYDKEGQPTEPVRFPRKVLEKRRRGMGDSAFMLQYMLDTSLADQDKFPLKVSDLLISNVALDPNFTYEEYMARKIPLDFHIGEAKAGDKAHYCKHDGQRVSYTYKLLTLDPAGAGDDDFAYCVLGVKNGFVHVLAQGHWEGFAGSRVDDIKEVAERYSVNEILVETNFGDELIINLLEPEIKTKITPVKNYTHKCKRIISVLEPVLNQKKMVVDKSFLMNKGIQQFCNITPIKGSLKHDDYLDALATGVKHLSEHLRVNVKQARREAQKEALEAELDAIINDVKGHVANPSWNPV